MSKNIYMSVEVHSKNVESLKATFCTASGPFEIVTNADCLAIRCNGISRVAKWTDDSPNWDKIRASDIEKWKYELHDALVTLPAPQDQGSTWLGMVLPARFVFVLWNAWLRARKQ